MFRKISLLIALALVPLFIIGCSSDIEEEPLQEDILAPEPVPPEPDWADSRLTIKVGRFKTPSALLAALESEKKVAIGIWTKDLLLGEKESVPKSALKMAEEEHTVDIAVISMLDVGMREAASMEEIRERFKEFGYRPLTVEETCELRLQFLEQINIPLSEEMHGFLTVSEEGFPCTFRLCRDMSYRGAELSAAYLHDSLLFEPTTGYHSLQIPPDAALGARFACAVIK